MPSLLNREGFEEVLSIAGVHKFCPPLLPITMGKAKKEDLLRELHCNNDGEGTTKTMMGRGDKKVS